MVIKNSLCTRLLYHNHFYSKYIIWQIEYAYMTPQINLMVLYFVICKVLNKTDQYIHKFILPLFSFIDCQWHWHLPQLICTLLFLTFLGFRRVSKDAATSTEEDVPIQQFSKVLTIDTRRPCFKQLWHLCVNNQCHSI